MVNKSVENTQSYFIDIKSFYYCCEKKMCKKLLSKCIYPHMPCS